MTIANNRRLQSIMKKWENTEKLKNISRQLEIFVYSLKKSRVWERRLANKCKY